MAELKINGRKRVKTLKAEFKELFGSTLRIYTTPSCRRFADDDATLASIRAEGAIGGDMSISEDTIVSTFEKEFTAMWGIGVQIANADNTTLAPNDATLIQAASK